MSVRLLALLTTAGGSRSLEDAQNLVFAHDEILFAINLDFRSAVLAKQNAVALLYVEGLTGTVFFIFSLADRDDFTFLWFFLGGVGDDDAPSHLLTLFDTAHNYAIVKRSDVRCHKSASPFIFRESSWVY